MPSLSKTAAVAVLAALGARAQWNDVPPSNDSATNPWWPQYPEGTSKYDFMMNDTSNDEDLKGNSRIAKWIVTTSNVWRAQFGESFATSARGAREQGIEASGGDWSALVQCLAAAGPVEPWDESMSYWRMLLVAAAR